MVGDASELTPVTQPFGFSSQVLVSDLAHRRSEGCRARPHRPKQHGCVSDVRLSFAAYAMAVRVGISFMFAVSLALVDQYIGKPVCWAVRSESSLRQLLR